MSTATAHQRRREGKEHAGERGHRDPLGADSDDLLSAHVGDAWGQAVAGSPSPLPYRNEMEERFGEDFSRVRAFLGRPGPMEAIGAHAATRGEDVVFAERAPSRKLVAHELTHVVQRRRGASGRVRKSLRLSQPGDAAEREAERVGEAVQRQPREQGLPLAGGSNGATASKGGISRAKKNIGYQDNHLLLEGSEYKTNAKNGLVSEAKKATRKTVLKRLKKKGVSYVRVMFYWRKDESSIEKLKTQLPSFFEDVRDVKMRAYVTLTGGTKSWTGGGGDFTSKNKSSEIASYKSWMQEVLKLAKDSDKSKKGFDDVSIWNEPNLSTFLKADGKGFGKNKKKNVSVAKTYVDIYRDTTMDSTTGDLLDKSAKHAFGEISSKLALEFLKAIETNERRQKREISKENKQAAKNQTKGSSSPSTTKHYHPVIAHYLALHPYKDDPNSGKGQRSGALNARDLKALKAQLRSMRPYLQTPGGKALPIRITEFGYPDSEYGERNALNLASRLDRTGLTPSYS